EVQVGVDDYVDLAGIDAGLLEICQQSFLRLEDGAQLVAELVADAGLDEHVVLAGAHQDGVQPRRNAVEGVRRDSLFPKHFRNYAEHGAAIEPVIAVGEHGQLEIAYGGALHRDGSLKIDFHRSTETK